MRIILITLLIALSSYSFAEVGFNDSGRGDLNKNEAKTVENAITRLVNDEYEGDTYYIEVEYSCTSTPMMKVFCTVSISSEGGMLGAGVVTYDRFDNTAKITSHVRD